MNKFSARIDLELYSQYTQTVPSALIKFSDAMIWQGKVDRAMTLSFNTPGLAQGNHWLTVEFENKDDSEQLKFGKDMMLGIESVRVENYDHDFSIYSEYQPQYPEPWYQEQSALGKTPEKIIHSNYLGWSGVWRLEVGLPIYRWIHTRTNQGWLI